MFGVDIVFLIQVYWLLKIAHQLVLIHRDWK